MDTQTEIRRTGIEIIETRTEMTLPELARYLTDLGLRPYQSRSSGSIINGKPIHRGEARSGSVHMFLYPYYIIQDPHCTNKKERGGSFTFFGMGDQIVRNEKIPIGTLVLTEPIPK